MQLWYGNYGFLANNPTFTIVKNAIETAEGRLLGFNESWTVDIVLEGTNQAAITTAIRNLEAAMVNGYDLYFKDDAGNVTPHAMLNRNSSSGVKVKQLSYPIPDKGQYANRRDVRLVFEGVFLTNAPDIFEFIQTISMRGIGGPRHVWKFPPVGSPVRQEVAQRTTYKANQTGSATGLRGHPNAPAPFWPQWINAETAGVERSTPVLQADGTSRYRISWNYEFESNVPLFAAA